MRAILVGWVIICSIFTANVVFTQDKKFQGREVEIKGTVVDFLGVPVDEAVVKLRLNDTAANDSSNKAAKTIYERETKTDKNGKYGFTNLPEGSFTVTLARHLDIAAEITKQSLELARGTSYRLDFVMHFGCLVDPRMILYGRVTTGKNESLEGARVYVINAFDLKFILSADIDKKGYYRIGLCTPGQYIVLANAPQFQSQVVNFTYLPPLDFKQINFTLQPLLIPER